MTRGHTIEITTPDGSAEAYVSRPTTPPSGAMPGVILFMDAIGLRPQIEKIADRISDWGYVVLAPNVFYRHGSAADIAPKTDLRLPGEREKFFPTVSPLVAGHTPDQAARDLPAYIAALTEQPGVVADRIGATGYCMGARLALRAAAQLPDQIRAVGLFHGGGLVTEDDDSPHRVISNVQAELVAGFADQDHSMPPEAIEAFDAALVAAGVTATTATYPGAPHGYTMADTSMYDQTAAERHFSELRDLFSRALA